MTSEQIRREANSLGMGPAGSPLLDLQLYQARFLAEIAAQLAELNERLQRGNLNVNVYDMSPE